MMCNCISKVSCFVQITAENQDCLVFDFIPKYIDNVVIDFA